MKKFLAAAAVMAATLAFALGVHAEDALGRILAMEGQERLEFLQARSHGERVEFLEYFVTLGREEKLAFLESLTNDEIEEIRMPIAEIVIPILEEYGVRYDGSGGVAADYVSAHMDRDGVIMGMLEFSSLESVADTARFAVQMVLDGRLHSRLWAELWAEPDEERAGAEVPGLADLGNFITTLEYDGSFLTLDDVRAMYEKARFAAPQETSEDARANPEHGDAEPFTQTRTFRHNQSHSSGMIVVSIAIDAMQANEGTGWANVRYVNPARTEHFLRAMQGVITDWVVLGRDANPRLDYSVTYRYSWRSVDNSVFIIDRELPHTFKLPTPHSTGAFSLPHREGD